MRRRLVALTLVVSFFYSTSAVGEMRLFPMWERMQCPTEEFACYTFEQSKTILKLDLDLQEKLSILPKLEQNILDLKLSLKKSDEALVEANKAKAVLDTRFKEKDEAFTKVSLQYRKSLQRDVFGGALPWVITAVILFAAAGFVGGVYAGKKL